MSAIKLAWLYFSKPQSSSLLKIIPRAAMLGLAFSLTIFITTLSVMNGFERDIRDRLLNRAPHLIIFEEKKINPDILNPTIRKNIKAQEFFVQTKMILPDFSYQQVQVIFSELIDDVTVSTALAAQTNCLDMDLKLMTFKSKKALWQPVPIIVTIVPVKELPDSQLIVYLPIAYKEKFKGLQLYPIQGIWLNNIMAVDDLDKALKEQDPSLMTVTWKKSYATIFDALLSEKRLISVVLTLLIVLIYVQLALTLILVFKDKEKDMIALYFFKGGARSVYDTFYLYGALNVTLGVILGCFGGFFVSKSLPTIVNFLENLFNFHILPYQQYYVKVFPSEFLWEDLIISGSVSLIVGLATTHLIVKYVSQKKMEQLLRQYQ